MTSVTIARPVSARAVASILRPSSLCPWKLYGLVRGLNAPPRRPVAPSALSWRARPTICSSLSTEHGPAITATRVPPTSSPRALTTVRSRFSSDEARLYGAMIGRTFSTPSPGSRASVSPGRSSPSAAMTVWCVPWITWGFNPSEVM